MGKKPSSKGAELNFLSQVRQRNQAAKEKHMLKTGEWAKFNEWPIDILNPDPKELQEMFKDNPGAEAKFFTSLGDGKNVAKTMDEVNANLKAAGGVALGGSHARWQLARKGRATAKGSQTPTRLRNRRTSLSGIMEDPMKKKQRLLGA